MLEGGEMLSDSLSGDELPLGCQACTLIVLSKQTVKSSAAYLDSSHNQLHVGNPILISSVLHKK